MSELSLTLTCISDGVPFSGTLATPLDDDYSPDSIKSDDNVTIPCDNVTAGKFVDENNFMAMFVFIL